MSKLFIPLYLMLVTFSFGYEIQISGPISEEIKSKLEASSYLCLNQDKSPTSLPALEQRVNTDKKNLLKLMHYEGFFDSHIDVDYGGVFPTTSLKISVDPGQPYRFGQITIEGSDLPILPTQLPKKVSGETIAFVEKQCLASLKQQGYPFSDLIEKKALIHQETKTCDVTYHFKQGPKAYFGALHLEGLQNVGRNVILKKVLWKENDPYNPTALEQTTKELEKTGLFSLVMVQIGKEEEASNLPVTIHVMETKHRHITAGLNYSTDHLIGVESTWIHDNFSGKGDKMSLTLEGSIYEQKGKVCYEYPSFFSNNQVLAAGGELKRKKTPGFEEREIALFARSRLDQGLSSLSYGLQYEMSITGKVSPYYLLSMPIYWSYNPYVHDFFSLKPFCRYHFTPYCDLAEKGNFFCKNELSLGQMVPLQSKQRFYIYGVCSFSSIIGQDLNKIPLPKRIYGGSGSHLKGYKYMTIAPYENGSVVGGYSSTLMQLEGYLKCFENFYLSPFFAAGNVYNTSFFDLRKKPLRSVGIGGCYLSSYGPFRIDVGIPLDRRQGIDEPFQLYFSFGQRF